MLKTRALSRFRGMAGFFTNALNLDVRNVSSRRASIRARLRQVLSWKKVVPKTRFPISETTAQQFCTPTGPISDSRRLGFRDRLKSWLK